jgi:uncharacterized BrkB/YihY/UPF0761 family membrane protein
VLALTVSSIALLWTSMGVSQAGLFAMAQIWNLLGPDRPNYLHRLVRSLAFIAVMAAGLMVTTALATLWTVSPRLGYVVGAELLVLFLNSGQYLLAFRVLTPKVVETRKLWPGAVAAGIVWTVLQALGGYLLEHELRGASQVYGTFAIVLGLVFWVFLGVRVSLYAVELNTVINRRLWPRSIVQPPLTRADEVTLSLQAKQNQRRPRQTVTGTFYEPRADPGPSGSWTGR